MSFSKHQSALSGAINGLTEKGFHIEGKRTEEGMLLREEIGGLTRSIEIQDS